jgi:hypothetical protein
MGAWFELFAEVDVARDILLGVCMLQYELSKFKLLVAWRVLINLPKEFI